MEKKRIICISHAFLKKINLSVFEELSKDNNIQITCIAPKFLYINRKKKDDANKIFAEVRSAPENKFQPARITKINLLNRYII